jgi:hypothetical protein
MNLAGMITAEHMRRLSGHTLLAAALLALAACGSSDAPGPSGPEPTGPTLGPLISGSVSWVDGRHVWTDYAYDDRGSQPAAAYPGGIYAASQQANGADLIQLQLALDDAQLHIRAILQTLIDPQHPLLGIGLDLDGDPQTGAPSLSGSGWDVAGTPLGLERLIVAGGGVTRVLAWTDGAWIETVAAALQIDTDDNRIDVSVERSHLGASGTRWRVLGMLGLADASWLDGEGPILDLAYVRDPSTANWQSGLQAEILSGRADAAQAMATIELADFARRRTALARPEPGIKQSFLYRSALRLGEGIQTADRKYAGPYQPYGVWFPDGLPQQPPLIVFMHGALQNHLSGPYGDDQPFAPQAVVVTPLGRGEAFGWYAGASEQDVLDVSADAQRRFNVDADRIVLSGYSLGGVGTFALAQLYPDRWAGAIEIVGAPDLGLIELLGIALPQPSTLENLRNLPFRMGHARLDELELIVGVIQPDLAALRLAQLGYDHRYWQFYLRSHVNFPVHVLQCEYAAAIARGRVVDPARVVYAQEPALRWHEPDTGLDLRHDAAYWVSQLVVRGNSFRPGDKGVVDVTSLALPDQVPRVERIAGSDENLSTGRDVCGDNPEVRTNDIWTVVGQAWTGFDEPSPRNAMLAKLTRVDSVTLDLPRMRLDPRQPLELTVESDGPGLLRLRGSWPAAVHVERNGAPPLRQQAQDGVLELTVTADDTTLFIRP